MPETRPLSCQASQFPVIGEFRLQKHVHDHGFVAEADVNSCQGCEVLEIRLIEHFLDNLTRRSHQHKFTHQTEEVRRSLVGIKPSDRIQLGCSITQRRCVYSIAVFFPVYRPHDPLLDDSIDIPHPSSSVCSCGPIFVVCGSNAGFHLHFRFSWESSTLGGRRSKVRGVVRSMSGGCRRWIYGCPALAQTQPSTMWGRIKGQVNWPREDQDASDDDTIISRALLRYYAPNIPPWLADVKGAEEYMKLPPGGVSHASQSAPQYYQPDPSPQSYSRRGSSVDGPRKFERSDSFASPSPSPSEQSRQAPKPSQSKPSSGLASRLKNTHW